MRGLQNVEAMGKENMRDMGGKGKVAVEAAYPFARKGRLTASDRALATHELMLTPSRAASMAMR